MEKRFITIEGPPVEVSEDVYRAFKRPAWTERKRRQVRKDHEVSLESYGEETAGWTPPFEDALIDGLMLEETMDGIAYGRGTEPD